MFGSGNRIDADLRIAYEVPPQGGDGDELDDDEQDDFLT